MPLSLSYNWSEEWGPDQKDRLAPCATRDRSCSARDPQYLAQLHARAYAECIAKHQTHPHMETREYDIVLIPQPEGGDVVSVPDLPSVATEGETVEEAMAMAKDAIEGYIAAMRDERWERAATRHERVAVSV